MYEVDMDDAIPRFVPGLAPVSTVLRVERTDLLLRVAIQRILTARFTEAEALLRELIAREPEDASAYSNLASLRERVGEVGEAVDLFDRALSIAPENTTILSNSIFAHDRHHEKTAEHAYERRRRYNALVATPYEPHENDRDPDRVLRVGYVSGDFHHHSAAFGFAPVLLSHSSQIKVYGYDTKPIDDDMSAMLRERAVAWQEVGGLSDDDLAALIREDRIDVLVDLSGHSAGNRLPVFARKPAPVQVTAWGYITGTGLDAMDAMFADAVTVRPDEERWYAEEIIRLPRLMPYLPADPENVGEVAPSPCLTNGYLTFGVYQRLGKLKQETVALWARVLAATPDARLIVKAPGLEQAATRLLIEGRFLQAGADLGRIELRGSSAHYPHLRSYADVDLMLDPSPDGGGISTLDAAWMGVPTLTLPHHQIPSRFTATLNQELGLDKLTVSTPEEYAQRAAEMVGQRAELGDLRLLMRDLMVSSAFCDARIFIPPVEQAYRVLWRRWCSGETGRQHHLRVA